MRSSLILAITSLFNVHLTSSTTIRVIHSDFSTDHGLQVNRKLETSGARLLDDRRVSLSDFSVCIRFHVKILNRFEGVTTPKGNSAPILHISPWDENATSPITSWFQFNAEYPRSYVAFGYPIASDSYHTWLIRDPESNETDIWATRAWNHLCFSYEKSNSFVKIVKNGQITNVNHVEPRVENVQLPSNILQNIHIGQCPNAMQKPCAALGGKFTDFNLWNRPLSDQEMKSFTTCSGSNVKGNVVSWDRAQFQLFNMNETFEAMESVCVPMKPGDVLLTNKNTFPTHLAICNMLKGKVSVMDSQEQKEKLRAIVQERWDKYKATCWGHIWAGYWDVFEEGVYSNANDRNLTLDWQPWLGGEPNGGQSENCAADLGPAWIDWNCFSKACGFCYFEKPPTLKLRGLCKESLFDHKYTWSEEPINGRYAYFGLHSTQLYYNKEQDEWTLRMFNDENNNATFATIKGKAFPFGTRDWTVVGDVCHRDTNGTLINQLEIPLSINSCKNDEYNCKDGTCIPMGNRCDGRIHCPDRSDETQCEIFFLDNSYLKFVPPVGAMEDSHLPVKVSVEVLNVLGISEVDNFIHLQTRIQMAWKDERLQLFNLKADQDLNSLTYDMREQLWLPEIVFYNTDKKYESRNDEKTSATVEKNGTFRLSPTTSLSNSYTFRGADNPIVLSRVYNHKYLCDFDMGYYPFDAQNCSAVFVMKGKMGKFVALKADQLDFSGPTELTQYFVQSSRIHEAEVLPGVRGVKVELIFARRLLSTFLTTYLPTILICIVSFTTNFYDGFFFEAIVTVNLTSMLLLVTLFISVSESLPKTAYVKNMDVWLIFVLFIPFCEVVIHTLIDNLRGDEDRRINHHGVTHRVTDTDPNLFDDKAFELVPQKTNRVNVQEAKGRKDSEGSSRSRYHHMNEMYLKRMRRLTQLRVLIFISRFVIPAIFTAFACGYFAHGIAIYSSMIA